MISVIICSVNEFMLGGLRSNIRETIGVPYEIIAIDNKVDKNGICSVYNKAGNLAKFPILCFVHEDVFFQTDNWGMLIGKHFSDKSIGLIGIAGGDTKSIVPSSWSVSFLSNEINIVQHYKAGHKFPEHVLLSESMTVKTPKKVATLDGVFLCTRKEIFDQYKFDEVNFKGFHGYDIDYSLQLFNKYHSVVIFDVLINHYSEGRPDKAWMKSAITLSKKWRRSLPVSVYPLTNNEFNLHHWKSMQVFLSHLFRLRYNYLKIIFFYFYYGFSCFFTVRRFLSMGKYIIVMIWQDQFNNRPGIFKQRSKLKYRYPGRIL